MSHSDRHVFDPDCRGCQPAIVDVKVGVPFPDDHPITVAAVAAWRQAPREEQEAYHRVMVESSRDPETVRKCELLVGKIQAAISKIVAN